MLALILLFQILILASSASGADINSLPIYQPEKMKVKGDWLIKPVQAESGVFRTDNVNEIVLSNGLISRTFRIAPNAATVNLVNRLTDETVLRGVKPEANVTIDGHMYNIGGLTGQPNYAFLQPEWIEDLTADPAACQFVGFEIGKPLERVKWKQVRHYDKKSQWPPSGAYLRMDYRMPDESELAHTATYLNSDKDRRLMFTDDFMKLDSAWKLHESKAHDRSSFYNEGKMGEIYTPANTCVFAERNLSQDARLVELTLDAGTDHSASWGPGITLVCPKRTIKFYLRSTDQGKMRFGLWNGSQENVAAGGGQELDKSKSLTLRMRWDGELLLCEAKPDGGNWRLIEKLQMDPDWGVPAKVRVGKTSRTGGADDFTGDKGDIGRMRLMGFSVYGVFDPETDEAAKKELGKNKGIRISIHYEIYDGVPCICKWLTVHNDSNKEITVDQFTSEILAAVEYESRVESRGVHYPAPNIHVETDYAFAGMTSVNSNRHCISWENDPDYKTQVSYLRQTPCLLKVRPEIGPAQTIKPGDSFESFRTFVLLYDGYDRERNGLARRRMNRICSPWVTENPLMMHARFADWNRVKKAIDQSAQVGFEMVILTFGSGFNIENNSAEYLARMKEYADYARSKGIEIGGYSLLASRRVGGGNDIELPDGKSPRFGNSPCICSDWGRAYFQKLYDFYDKTGFALLEHDGSYPGDPCKSQKHSGHKGWDDSRWNQYKIIKEYYQWCQANGVYLNVPDYYFLAGSNKCGMGYREVNWSLPREQQVIHTRQNVFDGTWNKTPSMGWMFVPLTQYHGGGAAATIEPLHEHLDHYKLMMISNLGAGVQACYRGPRLYDTDETKAMVTQCVDWYKKHRDVLEGDVIHLRRADGRDIDYWLNVNPFGEEKGLLMVYNPLSHKVKKSVNVPLYYTGLTDNVQVNYENGKTQSHVLSRDFSLDLNINIPAKGVTWYVFK